MQLFSSMAGSDFVVVYSVLIAVSGAAAFVIPVLWRSAGRRGDVSDFESAALLAGGPARMADAVMADLYVRGGLEASGGNRLAVARRDIAAGPAAQAVLALEGLVTTRAVRGTLAVQAERLGARLRRAGLLMWPEEQLRLRWLSTAPLLAVLLLGLARLRTATNEGEPVGPLTGLIGLTLVLAAARFVWSDPRTKAGGALVEVLKARHGRSLRGARGEGAAMAVALHGTVVLVGTPWEPLHALRQSADATGSNADGSSGDWGDGGGDCDGGGDGGGCGD